MKYFLPHSLPSPAFALNDFLGCAFFHINVEIVGVRAHERDRANALRKMFFNKFLLPINYDNKSVQTKTLMMTEPLGSSTETTA